MLSDTRQSDRMTDPTEQQVLHALFCLSRANQHISATTLAASVGTTPTRAAAGLLALERAGLVDATRARLTMLGLATAVRLGPAAGGPRLQPRGRVSLVVPIVGRAPLAARPTVPVHGDGVPLGLVP
jgi:hypothetical protein